MKEKKLAHPCSNRDRILNHLNHIQIDSNDISGTFLSHDQEVVMKNDLIQWITHHNTTKPSNQAPPGFTRRGVFIEAAIHRSWWWEFVAVCGRKGFNTGHLLITLAITHMGWTKGKDIWGKTKIKALQGVDGVILMRDLFAEDGTRGWAKFSFSSSLLEGGRRFLGDTRGVRPRSSVLSCRGDLFPVADREYTDQLMKS